MNPTALYQQVLTLYQQGRFKEAEGICLQLLEKFPEKPELLFMLGNAELQQKRYDDALSHIQQAARINPDKYEYHLQIGIIYYSLNKNSEAIESYRRANTLKPGDEAILSNLALALKQDGVLAETESLYHQILTINPNQPKILFFLSNLKKFNRDDDNVLQQIRSLLHDDKLNVTDQGYLHFALAKALSDIQDHDASFSHLKQGNALVRSTLDFNLDKSRRLFDRIKTTFNAEFFSSLARSGSEDETPIFIVGMPRSGSTLTEQILASHPLVYGADEQIYFYNAAYTSTATLNKTNFPEAAASLENHELKQIADHYLTSLRSHSDNHPHITDKMLGNIIHVGLIKMVFPRAKVIHCLRHPLDTCFSCYRHFFGTGILPYSYSLNELGNHYLLYRDLMRHWQQTLGGFILDIYYEDIVQDHIGQTQKILDFCNLPWDDACINFHRTARTVKTASLSQVRQPINRSGLDTWQPYQQHLQPLMTLLEQEVAAYATGHGQ